MNAFLKKYITVAVVLFTVIFHVSAQESDKLWKRNSELEKNETIAKTQENVPKIYKGYHLNLDLLKNDLKETSKLSAKSIKKGTVLSFPNEAGEIKKFEVFEASVMDESLQHKFPNIRSYIGKSIDNEKDIIRFSITPLGFHGMILQHSGANLFINPIDKNANSYYTFEKKELPEITPFECKFDALKTVSQNNSANTFAKAENANDGNLRTFRLAIATTGEYSQFHLTNQSIPSTATVAEKKAAVLAAIAVTMTRVNGIFERDVALTMQLVANNTNLIFLDATTDGFTNNDANLLIDESQSKINTIIGTSAYDIGHTFSTGAGGLAQAPAACTSGKARGVTGSSSPIGDPYNIDFVAHEMGHQFGAHHTFNSTSGNCNGDNRSSGTSIEPGSGTTIMSYAGICAPDNVQNQADPYFHLVSVREMWTNIVSGASNCGVVSSTGNVAPTINDLPNYTLPVSTPFVLNAVASDVNGDNLTYTWEQLDTEITTYPLVSTATVGPAFRSLPPSNASMRYFPDQGTVKTGNLSNTWEVLPSVSRTMRFGVNVRDNNSAGGQTASKETLLTFTNVAGPFKVTSQNTTVNWDAGTTKTIIWDVANTNIAPVNCSFVNILLSTDGGVTFPITLASHVENTGSRNIVVPNVTTSVARIKVESEGNVFYSINTANIAIQSSEFIMNFDAYSKNICLPSNAVYTFTYNTYLEFNQNTTFSASGNPAGSNVVFNPASASADNTVVQMTVSDLSVAGNYDITVNGTSSTVTKNTNVNLGVFKTPINSPVLTAPLNNATGVLTPFTLGWEDDVNAVSYQIEISEDAGFTVLTETANSEINQYNPQNLMPNTLYFWRVKAINNCGESDYSQVFSFTTENNVCDSVASTDTPKNIPDNNTTGVNSILFITQNKSIRDVNVTVNISHPWIGDLDLMLISPIGKSVLLVASRYDDGDNYTNTVFDDDASVSIDSGTAPFTGTYRPQGNLSSFNNDESYGNWKLKAVDGGPEDIGIIEGWSIEICGVPILGNDDDKDGVANSLDLCPNTPLGSTVDTTGCPIFTLPANNFTIEVIGETCPDKNNGQIKITSQETHDYSVTVNGTAYNFTNAQTITDLPPNIYNFCISVSGESYEQCYEVTVSQGNILGAKAALTSNKATIEITQGTAPFKVFVNDNPVLETSETVFEVSVKSGDVLQVKSSVECEGIFSKTIDMFTEIIAYPNPTQGIFEIALPTLQQEVKIGLYSILSQLISEKTYSVINGKIQLSLENKPAGLYLAKIYTDKPITIKIIKQ